MAALLFFALLSKYGGKQKCRSKYRQPLPKNENAADHGVLRCVRLKLESQKTRKNKHAAAVYLYQAMGDGEWGEIHFERGTAEIIRLTDWDTMRTNFYAKMVIRYVMKCKDENLPKEILLGFEW